MTENRKNQPLKILMAFTIFLILMAILGVLYVLRPAKSHRVEILQDDEVLYTFDLSTAEDQELLIPYGNSSNTILIQDGTICVARAQCPDNTCVYMGVLRWEGLPIVCLPNHLIIRFVG